MQIKPIMTKNKKKLKLGFLCFDLQPFTEECCFRIAEALKGKIDFKAFPLYFHKNQKNSRVDYADTTKATKTFEVGGGKTTPDGLAKDLNFWKSIECVRYSDIILLYGIQGAAAIWTAIAGKLSGKVIITVTHAVPVATELKRKWWIRLLKRLVYSCCKFHICQSTISQETLHQVYKIDKKSIFYAPFEAGANIFDTLVQSGTSDLSKIKDKYDLNDKPVFLFVGNLLYLKGIDVLLEAVSKLDFDFKLLVIGRDSQTKATGKNYYLDYAKKLNISSKVIFISELEHSELISFYKAADLFILPTRKDCTPKVLIEAALTENALITTDSCGYYKDIIQEDINGYVVKANSPEALSEAITKLKDKRKCKQFGIKSRQIVLDCCDKEKELKGFTSAIEKAIQFKG